MFQVLSSLISSWKYKESALQIDDAMRIAENTRIPLDEVLRAVSEGSPDVEAHVQMRRNQQRPPRGPGERTAD